MAMGFASKSEIIPYQLEKRAKKYDLRYCSPEVLGAFGLPNLCSGLMVISDQPHQTAHEARPLW